jgi:hypothetical protein
MCSDGGGFVDNEAFREAVRPISEVVAAMAGAGYAQSRANVDRSRTQPAVHSSAMRELAEQVHFAGNWDRCPIDTAQTHIGLLFHAGEDAMWTFSDCVVADRTPVYSLATLARTGVECLALAHWLSEPGIGTKERVRRSLNERIYSARQQSRLGGQLNPEPDRQARMLEAVSLGFETERTSNGTYLAPRRPSITDMVIAAIGASDAGKTLYSYMSALAHGAIWGLVERTSMGSLPPRDGVEEGAIEISSANIAMLASGLVLAHTTAYGGYLAHMGWTDAVWSAAAVDGSAFVRAWAGQKKLDGIADAQQDSTTGLWVPGA